MTGREPPAAPGVEHRFVDVGGLRTHVALAGIGDPLVLLHGWPQNWWQWRHLIGPLAEHHRVICPDLRGLGWTDAPRDGYRASVMADDVMGLLDRLGVHRFGLIGHDWGGLAGYLIALRHPDRVTGYLALNTANPFLRPTPRVLLSGARLWHVVANALPWLGPRLAASAIPRWALRHWTYRAAAMTPADREVFLARFREPARVDATVRYYRNLLVREIPLLLAGRYRGSRLTVPTLVLSGDRDPLLPPAMMSGFAGQADDLRVELIEHVGHFPATEAPARVTERALSFFGAAAASGRTGRPGR
ncbi:pimeloyl-ACP methyl ester carboxylesterase [Actinocorallia herbida]|uniref:Pimeloyl-ACP methyl ester carboxylesterase n=1 Tax=Actinocorallia herbida TaxID=58109 RepID=A0A3N1CXR9_9ACTN|nr:alpha/beta hydrolase [Actinocorallia herbida]ROO86087.1 pimeloyl-ACP methyl ester carboxylesterase [Actinocorallia herbida]